MHTFDLKIDELSKIEGKASLNVKVEDGEVKECRFKIDEFKRFYTQAIRGKDVMALPQLTSRICGTCSNAHLLCAIKACENALNITPSSQTILLRKLLNFGLIIRDHALHLYVFVMPDILGVDNILELDEKNPAHHRILDDTFMVKAAGNKLSKVIGGRSVHAPFPTVGGFTKMPDEKQFPELIRDLKEIRPAVLRLIEIFTDSELYLERDTDYVALMNDDYSFLDGCIMSNNSPDKICELYGSYLKRIVVPYSQAVGYKFEDRIHMIGSLARMNLGKNYLHKDTKKDTAKALALFPSKNIFHNNLAQALEILHALDSSISILSTLEINNEKPVPVVRKEGTGVGVIEAPRGTLYYRISLNDKGVVKEGDIIVPTGQNQIGIENSIFQYIRNNLNKPKDILTNEVEKIIRAYDPCMSCASHFLKVKWF